MLTQGIFPAITTPFYPDGRLYLKKLEHNVDRYSRTPVSGLVVLGSTGETVLLTDGEQREVLRVTRESASNHKVLIAGTGQESAFATLALTEFAAKLAYDIALVRTPSYYRPQMKAKPESILAHYRFIADRSPLPVMLYSVPPFTAYDLPVEMIMELASHPNIIGIKESSGDVPKIADIRRATAPVKRSANVTEVFEAVTGRMLQARNAPVSTSGIITAEALAGGASVSALTVTPASSAPAFKLREKEVGFQVLAGAAHALHASLQAGAGGAVLAFAAAAPTACYEAFAAHKDGDHALADLKQQRITAAARRVASGLGIPGLKYAMDLNGYYGGIARLPLLPVTGEEKREIEQLMADLRN